MKYIDEFRDGELARGIARRIAAEAQPGRTYNLMEFCGGHTHAISRYGIKDLLPAGINMIHGPGCPVCVLPIGRIDNAIELATAAPRMNPYTVRTRRKSRYPAKHASAPLTTSTRPAGI